MAEDLMGQEDTHGEAREEEAEAEEERRGEGSAETRSDSEIRACFPTVGFRGYVISATRGWLLISGRAEKTVSCVLVTSGWRMKSPRN